MEKKTKALAAIAAGALAIGIALSVASCALRSAETDQQAVQEEALVEEAAQGQGAEAPAALTSYELACSKGWKSDAGSLQMSKGMVIEKGADGKIHVLTVSEVEEADAGKQAVFTVAGTDEDSQDSVTWTLIFDRSGGAATMSSDDFKVSKKYSEGVAEGNVPQAASASFDGEASVDFNAKTVSAAFHADDAARTVLVVTYADGKFTVSG